MTGAAASATPRFAGRVAFVTGAGQGQGAKHIAALAADGADIVALDRQDPDSPGSFADAVAAVRAAGGRIIARRADVRDEAALVEVAAEAMAEFGRIDIVLANAGVLGPTGPFLDLPADEVQRTLDINFNGVWNTCRATVPHLIAGGRGGSIVITSSLFGLKGYANLCAYSASKHAVVGLMRSLAIELGRHNIRVNSVHPTTVLTPMLTDATPVGPGHEDNVARLRTLHLLPMSWLEAEDVTNAILFLASDDARYMTGVALPLDGGASIR